MKRHNMSIFKQELNKSIFKTLVSKKEKKRITFLKKYWKNSVQMNIFTEKIHFV